jgi:hypothetical protein
MNFFTGGSGESNLLRQHYGWMPTCFFLPPAQSMVEFWFVSVEQISEDNSGSNGPSPPTIVFALVNLAISNFSKLNLFCFFAFMMRVFNVMVSNVFNFLLRRRRN